MDLRQHHPTREQIAVGMRVLNYQPFILSDDIQTGVAYSWLHAAEGGRASSTSEFIAVRGETSADAWLRFSEANGQLRAMYEDWLNEIARAYPGATLLDPACNNGYFPVRALQLGMSRATGYDREDYTASTALLNALAGTDARFFHRAYDSLRHGIEGCEPHDVVVATLIMCHISDPLYYLAFLGRMAREAIFLFTGMSTAPGYAITYSRPNRFYPRDEFPICFDNDVGLTRELLLDSLHMLGFRRVHILEWRPTWLPRSWYDRGSQQAILAMR